MRNRGIGESVVSGSLAAVTARVVTASNIATVADRFFHNSEFISDYQRIPPRTAQTP